MTDRRRMHHQGETSGPRTARRRRLGWRSGRHRTRLDGCTRREVPPLGDRGERFTGEYSSGLDRGVEGDELVRVGYDDDSAGEVSHDLAVRHTPRTSSHEEQPARALRQLVGPHQEVADHAFDRSGLSLFEGWSGVLPLRTTRRRCR